MKSSRDTKDSTRRSEIGCPQSGIQNVPQETVPRLINQLEMVKNRLQKISNDLAETEVHLRAEWEVLNSIQNQLSAVAAVVRLSESTWRSEENDSIPPAPCDELITEPPSWAPTEQELEDVRIPVHKLMKEKRISRLEFTLNLNPVPIPVRTLRFVGYNEKEMELAKAVREANKQKERRYRSLSEKRRLHVQQQK